MMMVRGYRIQYHAMTRQPETDTGENIKTLTRRDKEDSDIEIQTKKEDEKLKIQEYIKSRWNFCFIFYCGAK